jgi:hypothetical protein
MKVHARNPVSAWKTRPYTSRKLFLTYLEIPPLCSGANPCPPLALVSCILNPPHPLHSPFPLPTIPLIKKHALSGRHYDIGFA